MADPLFKRVRPKEGTSGKGAVQVDQLSLIAGGTLTPGEAAYTKGSKHKK